MFDEENLVSCHACKKWAGSHCRSAWRPPSNTRKAREVAVEQHDLGAMLECQRGQVGVVHEVARTPSVASSPCRTARYRGVGWTTTAGAAANHVSTTPPRSQNRAVGGPGRSESIIGGRPAARPRRSRPDGDGEAAEWGDLGGHSAVRWLMHAVAHCRGRPRSRQPHTLRAPVARLRPGIAVVPGARGTLVGDQHGEAAFSPSPRRSRMTVRVCWRSWPGSPIPAGGAGCVTRLVAVVGLAVCAVLAGARSFVGRVPVSTSST